MHLLYLDESGHADDPRTKFFVLAGFSVFERTAHWLDSRLTPIAQRFDAAQPENIELHGSPMRSGRGYWHKVPRQDRERAMAEVLSFLGTKQLNLKVFASVIEKSLLPADQIIKKSFENVACQFDQYLANIYHARREAQRGLVVFDKTSYEYKLQALSHIFKHKGHSTGKLRNFAEVPLFLDSKASRLIQMADMIAYAMFRHFESGDSKLYSQVEPHFYHYNGVNCGMTPTVSDATLAALAPSLTITSTAVGDTIGVDEQTG